MASPKEYDVFQDSLALNIKLVESSHLNIYSREKLKMSLCTG